MKSVQLPHTHTHTCAHVLSAKRASRARRGGWLGRPLLCVPVRPRAVRHGPRPSRVTQPSCRHARTAMTSGPTPCACGLHCRATLLCRAASATLGPFTSTMQAVRRRWHTCSPLQPAPPKCSSADRQACRLRAVFVRCPPWVASFCPFAFGPAVGAVFSSSKRTTVVTCESVHRTPTYLFFCLLPSLPITPHTHKAAQAYTPAANAAITSYTLISVAAARLHSRLDAGTACFFVRPLPTAGVPSSSKLV